MNLDRTITEPFARLIAFHNAFNLNVKFTYGALARLSAAEDHLERFTLPNGGEPWGHAISWNDMGVAVQDAAAFMSEMGVVRSASSFEDYIIGATAELDRVAARQQGLSVGVCDPGSGGANVVDVPEDTTPLLGALVRRLGIDPESIFADLILVDFFRTARNCVVHRSGRASSRLAAISKSRELMDALKTWPRRSGNWAIGVPDIKEGDLVPWLPRHAIMSSACHHRCAATLDAAVVKYMGVDGIVLMAAHWCLVADNRVACAAKLNAQTMIRTLLVQRYLARHVDMANLIQVLRQAGIWDKVRKAFDQHGVKRIRDARKMANNRPKR